MKASRPKLQLIDYMVMIGGPVLFLLIAWFGLIMLRGPAPAPNPVQLLREGEIALGSTAREVEDRLGRPSEVLEQEDGGFLFFYRRSVFDQQAKSVSMDEGVIEFTPSGRVQGVRFDRSAPPARAPD